MAGVTKPFFGLRGDKLNWLVVITAGLEFLLFGYDQGIMGGLLTLPSFTDTFPEICTTKACTAGMTAAEESHRSTIQGIAISCYNLGCFTGAVLVVRFGDLFGRRKAVFLGCTLVTIGAILQCSAFGLPHFIIGRVVCGMGTGINTATVPVWQAECIKPHLRGPVMAFETSLVIAGVMVSYWIDFGFSYVEPSSAAWRFPIAFQLIFSLFILCVITRLPESPRWLLLKDKQSEALEVLCALYDLSPEDTLINDEMQAISSSLHMSKKAGFKQIFINGPLKELDRTGVALSIQILSQLTGINIITYYAASIYENEIGLTPFMSRILAACNGTQYFIASIFSIPLIKYINRRPLLMAASTGLSASMVVLAICTNIGGQQAGICAAVFLFVFNTFFGIAWAQLSWIVPAESTPLSIRGPVNALSTSSNWICNFMVVMVTPVAFTNIGWRTYIIFAILNATAIPVIYIFYPETRGRSLEEVDLIFSESSSIFDAVTKSMTMERHFDSHGKLVRSLAQDVEHSAAIVDNSKKQVSVEHVE
ncbi:hypothetical protein ACHAPJ_006622 [Fusarium lateritium]